MSKKPTKRNLLDEVTASRKAERLDVEKRSSRGLCDELEDFEAEVEQDYDLLPSKNESKVGKHGKRARNNTSISNQKCKIKDKKGWPLGRAIVIHPEMFTSPAYRDLTKTQTDILSRFLQKRTWDDDQPKKRKKRRLEDTVYRNEDYIFTSSEAEWLGIPYSTFRRDIHGLVEHGFIIVTHNGGAYGPRKDPSRYRLVDTWKSWGTPSYTHPKKQPCVYTGSFDEYNKKRKAEKHQSNLTSDSQSKLTGKNIKKGKKGSQF